MSPKRPGIDDDVSGQRVTADAQSRIQIGNSRGLTAKAGAQRRGISEFDPSLNRESVTDRRRRARLEWAPRSYRRVRGLRCGGIALIAGHRAYRSEGVIGTPFARRCLRECASRHPDSGRAARSSGIFDLFMAPGGHAQDFGGAAGVRQQERGGEQSNQAHARREIHLSDILPSGETFQELKI